MHYEFNLVTYQFAGAGGVVLLGGGFLELPVDAEPFEGGGEAAA